MLPIENSPFGPCERGTQRTPARSRVRLSSIAAVKCRHASHIHWDLIATRIMVGWLLSANLLPFSVWNHVMAQPCFSPLPRLLGGAHCHRSQSTFIRSRAAFMPPLVPPSVICLWDALPTKRGQSLPGPFLFLPDQVLVKPAPCLIAMAHPPSSDESFWILICVCASFAHLIYLGRGAFGKIFCMQNFVIF